MNVNKETIIEGIGDEVLIVIAILVLVVVVFLIWLSKELHYLAIYFRNYFQSNEQQTQVKKETTEENIEVEEIVEKPNEFEINKINKIDEFLPEAGDNQTNNSNKEPETAPPGHITVKLKYLDDRTKTVFSVPQSTIFDFKRANFQEDLSNNKNVRLIYNGRELKELDGESTLAGYGVVDNGTVHCLITERREPVIATASSVTDATSMSEINMGSLMFPLFGVMLSLVWYYRLNYKHHFNIASTFVLVCLTGVYFVACFVNYSAGGTNRNNNGNHHPNVYFPPRDFHGPSSRRVHFNY